MILSELLEMTVVYEQLKVGIKKARDINRVHKYLETNQMVPRATKIRNIMSAWEKIADESLATWAVQKQILEQKKQRESQNGNE